MKRYLVLTHYDPIDNGDGAVREVQNWFKGAGGSHLNNSYEARVLTENDADKLPAWQVKAYGYKSMATAKRGLKASLSCAEIENGFGGWHVTCKIVEVEVND